MEKGEVVQPDPVLVLERQNEHFEVQQVEAIVQVLSGRGYSYCSSNRIWKVIVYAVLSLAFGGEAPKGLRTEFVGEAPKGLRTEFMGETPKGLRTEFVGEAQEYIAAMRSILAGLDKFVYISQEAILWHHMYRRMFLSNAYNKKLVVLTLDEAHYIAIWCVTSNNFDELFKLTKVLFSGREFRTAFSLYHCV